MQAAYPQMKKQGWGRVINMVSLNGVNAHVGTLEYNTAKEALRALTTTAAREGSPGSAARRVGIGCGNTWRSGWEPYHHTKNHRQYEVVGVGVTQNAV